MFEPPSSHMCHGVSSVKWFIRSSGRGFVALWHCGTHHPCHVPLCHVPTAFCGGWTEPFFLLALSILRFFATLPHIAAPPSISLSVFFTYHHHTLPVPLSLSLSLSLFPPPSFSINLLSLCPPVPPAHIPPPFPPSPPLSPSSPPSNSSSMILSPYFLSNLSFRSILASFSPINYSTSH